MCNVQQTVVDFAAKIRNPNRLWVGLSGGLDSCVLLHAVAHSRLPVPLKVLHINHQLSPNAGHWQQRCQQLAEQYQLPFVTEQVTVQTGGKGLESAARQARYQAFERHLQPDDWLLLAHHLDDQAETLLLRLMRGSGVRGLAAMAPVRRLGQSWVGRPLLGISRRELQAYAEAENLQWLEDESNRNIDFDRNFLRLEVMPKLDMRWPGFAERWGRTAALARESDQLLADYLAEDLQVAGRRRERLGESVPLEYVAELPLPRRNALLRYWVEACGYEPPEQPHLHQMARLLSAADDAQPQVAWGRCEMRRFANRIYLIPRLAPPEVLIADWQPPNRLSLPGGAHLAAVPTDKGLRRDCSYRVTTRRGGERGRPHSRQHSQTLKKLLQECQLEPWLRDRVPLIYSGDRLAAVGDLWVEKEFYVEGGGAWGVKWAFNEEVGGGRK